MIGWTLPLVVLAVSAPPSDASLHQLCVNLTWAPTSSSVFGLDPDRSEEDASETAVWTCRYERRIVDGSRTFHEVALIRVTDGSGQTDATHLALAVRELGWVHLGLLFEATPRGRSRVVEFDVSDRALGPEPEIVLISERDDGQSFERTARVCVDRGAGLGGVCIGIPIAIGEGRRRRKEGERLDLRVERDGRIALEQTRSRDLDLLAPLAGVHDVDTLLLLGRSLGPCDEGPCLRTYVFDAPQ
jgi:hypothetical protein